jgi:hypothetical protein
MAVLSMRPLPGKEGSFGPITEWSAKREWLAVCDSRFDEESTILAYGYANGILPVPFANVLGSNPLLLCWTVSPKQDKKSPLHWVVTASYSTQYLSKQEKDEQNYPNPVDRPAKFTWSSAKYNKPMVKDINGSMIVNSAGDPFDPPAEADRSRWTVSITKNVYAVPSIIIDYTDAINSGSFTIQSLPVAAQVAKIMSINIGEEQSAQIAEDSEITYFAFSYTMEFRPETWKLELLDQGFRSFDPNDATKRVHIKDDAVPAKFVTKPWPLDGSGAKLANPSTSNAVSKKFDIYNAKDFSSLPGINT